jgi:hypothetical protein
VSRDVLSVASGRDAALRRTAEECDRTKRRTLGATMFGLVPVLLLALFLLLSSIGNLGYVLVLVITAVLVHVSALVWIRSTWSRALADLDSFHAEDSEDFRRRVETALQSVIGPFLERAWTLAHADGDLLQPAGPSAAHFVRVRVDRPHERVPVQEGEMELLRAALLKRGLAVSGSPGAYQRFLTSAALALDYQDFSRRVDQAETNGMGCYGAYAVLRADDETFLPFLVARELAHGMSMSEADALSRVESERRRLQASLFEEDLSQRTRASAGPVTLDRINLISPEHFEELIAMIYESRGCAARRTGRSGDQGCDVLVEEPGARIVVQAKHYSEAVGNGAVQEAVAAKAYYACDRARVVTNNVFTRGAIELAASNDVELVDKVKLQELLVEFNRAPKDYPRLARLLVPESPTPSPTSGGDLGGHAAEDSRMREEE